MLKEVNDFSTLVTWNNSKFLQVLECVYHFDNDWLVKKITFRSSSDALDFMIDLTKWQ